MVNKVRSGAGNPRPIHQRREDACAKLFDKMREQIDTLASQAEFGVGGEHEEVLETYKMFAYDEGWSRRINEAIDSGLTAEAAIERVQQHTRMRMREIDDDAQRFHALQQRQRKGSGFASAGLGCAHHVTALQHHRNGLSLNGRHRRKTHLGDGAIQGRSQGNIRKSLCHVASYCRTYRFSVRQKAQRR